MTLTDVGCLIIGECMNNIVTNIFIMSSGERYCTVIDKRTGIPLFYPSLYITTNLRCKSDSISTIELHAGGIALFYRFMDEKKIDIESRISSGMFLNNAEIDGLRDYIERKVRKSKVVGYDNSQQLVSSGTKHLRLTAIARYLEWLSNLILKDAKHNGVKVDVFIRNIKARRPRVRYRNKCLGANKSLDQKQLDILFEVIRVGSDFNPFKSDVQVRNRLIILMLYHLGVRAGELLNIKISDINFSNHTISIRRRADEKSDPRKKQPLVKTLERTIPLSDVVMKEIHNYILKERRGHKLMKEEGYLFITHKSGAIRGLPLSMQAYHKIINVVRKLCPDLYNLTGHKLRHTWNYRFSKKMDEMDLINEEQQEQIRSYLMGWKMGSGTARVYNQRFIEKKAGEIAIKLQN